MQFLLFEHILRFLLFIQFIFHTGMELEKDPGQDVRKQDQLYT